MKECEKCGNHIPGDLRICPHCAEIKGVRQGNMRRLIGGIIWLFFAMAALSLCFAPFVREAGSLPMFIIVLFVFPMGFAGVFLVRKSMQNTWESRRIMFYKKHKKHSSSDSCYCKVCGKLVKHHDWERGRCKICGHTRDYDFRLNLADRLADQNLAQEEYYDIAKCAKSYLEHQIRAVRCLTNQNSLIDLAKNNDSDFVRFEAAQLMDDQSLAQGIYCDIAKKYPNGGFTDPQNGRLPCIQTHTLLDKIIDKELLVDVIMSVSFHSCQSALSRIDDNDTLDCIARRAKDADVRAKACEKSGGHLYEESCVCKRCNAEEHSFSDRICMRCNAMFKETRSEHKCSACGGTGSFRSYEMISPGYSGSDNYQDSEWGYITRECGLCRGTGKITDVSQHIVYASGEEKLLKSIYP